MKRTVAIILLLAMMVCMLPVLPVVAAESEPTYGLNADFYQLAGLGNSPDPYRNIIGTDSGDNALASFEDTQRYDESIETLMAISAEATTTFDLDVFPPSLPGYDTKVEMDWEGYMIKWTGTITATTAGTYYLVGFKVDNGFVAFVDQDGEEGAEKKVYEYWASHHWFDSGNDTLYSNLGGFELKANTPTEIEFWYMESNGGQVLDVGISTDANSGAVSFAEAGITFDVEGTLYRTNVQSGNHQPILDLLPVGVKADGSEGQDGNGNGSPADAAQNHQYASTVAAIKALMTKIGSCVVPNYESAAFAYGNAFGKGGDDYMIDYNGYVTATTGGTYEFGTRKVDNCLYVEIQIDGTWTPVYELWAKYIWNDEGETYYGQTVTLEEGKTYPIHATFLEIDGGEAIESRIKINDEVKTLADSGLVFTIDVPTAPVGPTTVSFFPTGSEWHYMVSGDNDDLYPEGDWTTDASVYSTWDTATADLGKKGSDVWFTYEDANAIGNKGIWAVREFTVEDIEAIEGWALMTEMFFDDNIHLYINGIEVFTNGTWNEGYETYKFAKNATDVLVEGKNVIAVSLWQGHGGYGIDLSLYATCENTAQYAPTYVPLNTIDDAEELLAFVAEVNANPEATKGVTYTLGADIDMAGKEWTPINIFYGKLEGKGHKISNITYKPTVDATSNTDSDGVPHGLLVHNLGNLDNIKGHIVNLTLENCTMEVTAVDGEETANYVISGLFAGIVDRGYISNCTASNSSIKGATVSGGIAGVACWAYDTAGVYVTDCTVENTTVEAKKVAGGIIGYARGNAAVILNDTTFANVTLTAPKTGYAYGGLWYTDLRGQNDEYIIMEKPSFRTDITLEAGKDYALYAQDRENADDSTKKDYRVIIIADTEWLRENYQNGFVITFSDGTTSKKLEAVPTVFYKNVKTDAGEIYDMYGAVGDTVVVGWVVTGVPAGFTPTVTVGNVTYGA